MKRRVDLVIVGTGFGGSILAMVARRLGCSVVLLEQGSHPRMAIGESTTPLSNLALERLSRQFDLPGLAPLTKWGSWQKTYPEIACGLKRGFSFFCQGAPPLLVAASPNDTIADTHWYRADVDHFLVQEARRLGVEYHEEIRIDDVVFTSEAAQVTADSMQLEAGLLIDATGPRGFLFRKLALQQTDFPGFPATECLYAHFTGVSATEWDGPSPYPVDDAAVHHIFPGGWIWVLRFGNGITSAGMVAEKARGLGLEEGQAAWQRMLNRVPALKMQFRTATPCQPFRYIPLGSFRSGSIVGPRWAMLPSAAGFIDPLLSSGFVLNLMGIERLADVLQGKASLEEYASHTDSDLLAVSRLLSALYATMDNFSAFTAVTFLYFAAVSFAETALRLGKPELAAGFLLDADPVFGPEARRLLQRAHHIESTSGSTGTFVKEVLQLIEPYNLGCFGKRNGQYPVHAQDLLDAAHKLGVSQKQVAAMLQASGVPIELSCNG